MSEQKISDGEISEADKLQLQNSEWSKFTNRLEIPLYHVIPRAAELVVDTFREPTIVKLRSLSSNVSDKNIQKALNAIDLISSRIPTFMAQDFSHISGQRSRIATVKADPELVQIRSIENEDLLKEATQETVKDEFVILTPGVIGSMPFIVDAGVQVGELDGTMFGWAFLQATYKQIATGGYISISTKYGLERLWSDSSKLKLAVLAKNVEDSRTLAWTLQAWNMAHPYEGGAIGLGKRS